MSAKLISALVLIGLFVILIIFNSGHWILNFPFVQAVVFQRQLLLAFVFVSGLITGVLLSNK